MWVRLLQWFKASDIVYWITMIGVALFFQHRIIPLQDFSSGHLYGDTISFMYVMSWGAHAIFHAPLSYYDAPAFHPASNVLFSTDGMELAVLLFSPLWYLYKNPALQANLVLLSSHLFTLVAAFYSSRLVIKANKPVALALAISFAGCSDRFWHAVDHLNLVWSGIIPLVFAGTWACLEFSNRRSQILLVLALGCSVYFSVYLFVLSGITVVCAVILWFCSHWHKPSKSLIKNFALTVALGLALCAPKILAYYLGSRENTRSHVGLAEAASLSATWTGYLRPVIQTNRFESNWYSILAKPGEVPYVQEDGQFIGYAVIVLLVLELLRLTLKLGRRKFDELDKLSLGSLAVALLLVYVSFGPAYKIWGISPYGILYEIALKFTSFFRTPARFAMISYWLMLISAGVYLVKLLRLSGRESLTVPALALLVVWFEHLPREPNVYNKWQRHRLFDVMQQHDPTGTEAAASFGYEMTVYDALSSDPQWRPIVNGWFGAAKAADYDRRYWSFKHFPSVDTVAWLAKNNVRWIMSNEPKIVYDLRTSPDFEHVAKDLDIDLFRLKNPSTVLAAYEQQRTQRRQFLEEQRLKTPPVLEWPADDSIRIGGGNGFKMDNGQLTYATEDTPIITTLFGFANRFIPGTYDRVEIIYSLGAGKSLHESKAYWQSDKHPMSEERAVEGKVEKLSSDETRWKVIFNMHEEIEWMKDESAPSVRFDFFNFASLMPVELRIESIKFYRLPEVPEIPYI